MSKIKIFKCKAYAKINLFLNVFNKTKDNLHKLRSLVCFVNLHDEIIISENKKSVIEIKGPFKNLVDKNNIAEKTYNIFSKFLDIEKKYKISIYKNIPVSAGLGGGSADAAAILKGLNYLNKNKVMNKDLYKLAMKIGSDVPACLYNKSVLFSGYGEILSPVPKIPKFSILLINPRKELSTMKVFNEYKKNKKNKNTMFKNKDFFSWILKQNNDLQKYSKKFIPEIEEMLSFLNYSNNCHFSRMTGSGPTVFGLFKKKKDAKKIDFLLNKVYPNWWSGVYTVKT